MPLLLESSYTPSFFLLKNRHFQTIYPALRRRVKHVEYRRERLELEDGDFLDLDWLSNASNRLAILLHGLEGSAARGYIKGMAKAFSEQGWDVLALNFRGCGGEPNRLLRSYHAGATDDLRTVVFHVASRGIYEHIGLIGFSLGANLMLKYLGEEGRATPSAIVGAVAFSVPCDLAASVETMSRPVNRLYMNNFLRQLRAKLEQKKKAHPESIDLADYREIKNFFDFDDRFTAPIHGFKDAAAYWRLNSCTQFLPHIDVPALIVNAKDDPFLNEACFPVDAARSSNRIFLERPAYGGHVGFMGGAKDDVYWSEIRAVHFLSALI